MNKTVKRYCLLILVSMVSGWAILMYYRITTHHEVIFDWTLMWKGTTIGLVLFAGVKIVKFFCAKWAFSIPGKEQVGKVSIMVGSISLVFSIALVLLFCFFRYDAIDFRQVSIPVIIGLSVGLCVLWTVEVLLAKLMLKTEIKGFTINQEELLTAMVSLISAVIIFVPVLSDYATKSFPLAYSTSSVISTGKTNAGLGVLGQITKGRHISQTFICPSKGLYAIQLYGATYMRTNTSTLQVVLIDEESEEKIDEWTLDARKFADNSYFTAKTRSPYDHLNMLGRHLRIEVFSADAEEGNALTLYYVKSDVYKDGELRINGEPQNGDLLMIINGIQGPVNYERVRIVLCLFGAVFVNILILFFVQHRKRHKSIIWDKEHD